MTKLCRRNKWGYCRHGGKCRYRHINEICSDKNCNVFICEKRHPKRCNYMKDQGQCKFKEYCRQDHKQSELENSKKIEKLEKKLESLQNPVDKKYNDEDYMKKFTEFDTKIDNLQKIVCQ